MKRILFFLIALSSLQTNVFAQTNKQEQQKHEILTQTIRGAVVDKQSQSPLIGATVIVLNTSPLIGAAADANGKFRLSKVPTGRQQVKITYLGYKEIVTPVLITSGKELILTVEMEESVLEKDAVVIKSEVDKSKSSNKMATVSARAFNVDEANRYAGSRQDPSRMAANYAGVVGASDARNDIIIRGNTPSGLLWRVEGVDVPNPNHYAGIGSTGGPISILNNNVLANSDFMTGAFTADYGNATSGVFDIKLRNGNNEKHEFTGQVGFNGFELGAEGPINKAKGSSYLLNYRYSTLGLLMKMGVEMGMDAVPYYQDVSFKLNMPVNKGIVSVFGLGGLSNITFTDDAVRKRDSARARGFNEDFGSRMGVAGISYTRFIDNNTYLKLIASGSYEYNFNDIDTLDASRKPLPYYNNFTSRYKYALNGFVSRKFSSRLSTKTGIMADVLSFDMNSEIYKSSDAAFQTLLANNGITLLTRGYSQWSYRFNDRLSFNPGINIQHLALNNKIAVEPRAGFAFEMAANQRLSFGYGMHSRVQELPVYFLESKINGEYLRTNKNLDFTKAQHFVLGYDWKILENLRLKSEVYYQLQYNVPVEQRSSYFSMLNLGADYGMPMVDSLVNNGSGRNYGVEFTLEKFFSKGYYFLVTTSLFESKYKGSDGIERNTAFSSNFVVNALAGKEFRIRENNALTVDFRFLQAGGKRYIPIDLEKSLAAKTTVLDEREPYNYRYSDYMRADVKIGYRINKKKTTQEIALSIENLTNHKNVFNKTFIAKKEQIVTNYQLGLFPMLFYKITF